MSCAHVITPCQPCTECIPCADANYCSEGCIDTYDFSCVKFTETYTSCTGIAKNDDGATVIKKLIDKVCALGAAIVVTSPDSTIGIAQSGTYGNLIQLSTVLSAVSGNILIKQSDGLYVPTETSIIATDSTSIDFTTSGTHAHSITAVVKISATGGNAISINSDGIYSATQTSLVATDTSTIDFTTSGTAGHSLTAAVKVSATGGNSITVNSDGIYAPTASAETSLVATDSTSIDFTTSGTAGHALTGVVKISATANNTVSISSDGLFAPDTTFVATDSSTIDFTTSGTYSHSLTGSVKLSASGGNSISALSDGLYSAVYTAGTGISISSNVITNSAPDVPVSITSGSNISVTGSYPNFTVAVTGLATVATTGSYTDLVSTPVFSNGLVQAGTSVKLGGTLTGATTISSAAFNFLIANTTDVMNGGKFGSGGTINLSGASTGGSEAEVSYAGTYGAISSTKSVNFTLDNTSIYAGIWAATYFGQTGTITNGIISAIETWSLFANTGGLTAAAGVYIRAPKQQTAATAFSGTCGSFYGLRIDDITGSSIQAQFTNKFAIYQVGTSDVSRFFGPVQNASSSVQFTSDIRVKENIVAFTRGLAEVDQMNTKRFNYIYNKGNTTTGLIAQELEAIIPEAVQQGNFELPDGSVSYSDFRMVDQTILFYTMLNAIKELSAKVKVLESK